MELKWLDDYLALIETGTFSAAAEKRHVSQPAFSRRIQLLEEWLGVALIDRSRKPLRFTPLASQHEAAFRSLATHIYEFQAALKSDATNSPGLVLAAQHSLAAAYLPTFLEELRALMPEQRFRIRSPTSSADPPPDEHAASTTANNTGGTILRAVRVTLEEAREATIGCLSR